MSEQETESDGTDQGTTLNGVDVDQLVETIEAIEADPELADFRFRATSTWEGGGRTETRIQAFDHAGQPDDSRDKPFVLQGDEPSVLLGDDTAPNAVETVLHALSSCLAVGFVYNAAAKGIEVESLDFDIEGELDLHGFLGLDEDTRAGYHRIEVTYEVEADAPREDLVELCEYVQETSPVVDVLRNPVDVEVRMA